VHEDLLLAQGLGFSQLHFYYNFTLLGYSQLDFYYNFTLLGYSQQDFYYNFTVLGYSQQDFYYNFTATAKLSFLVVFYHENYHLFRPPALGLCGFLPVYMFLAQRF
jgi:hypothetical protein